METQKVFMLLFTAILALTFVSAAINNPGNVVLTNQTNSVTITTNGNVNASFLGTIEDDSLNLITPTFSGPFTNTSSITLNAAANIDYNNLKIGTSYSTSYSTSLLLLNASNAADNKTISVEYKKAFCSQGPINDSQLELDISIDVDSNGDGNDDKWYPRDIVEVTAEFDNDLTDLDNVYFELGLFNDEGNNVAEDLDWIKGDESEKIGDIDDDDNEDYTFTFYVPTDFDAGKYQLVVKAYEDDNEEGVCIDYLSTYYTTEEIEIDISKESDDERLIVFEDIELSLNPATCGSEITLTATMYNIGDEKQEAVKANLYSYQLGVDEYSEVFTKFDTDDKQELEFIFTVPSNATEGIYKLSLVAYHSWDEDDDDKTYEDIYFDEKTDAEKVSLTLDGKCSDSEDADIEIGVVLSEDTPTAKAGKQVIVEATIENTGTGSADYKVSVSGISNWAEATISDNDFTLDAGKSKTIEIALDIDKDVKAGEKEFTIETTYGDSVKEQAVIVDVEEGFSLGFGSIGDYFKDNWFIYTVILVDLILITAIIIAVVRVAGRPRA